jgi:two-component system response regulator MprA
VLDARTRSVRRGGRAIELTPIEFSLLELFLANPGTVLPRSYIFTRVWGFDFSTTSNSLNVYVGYLRRKLEERGESRVIHTIRGVGYVLRR